MEVGGLTSTMFKMDYDFATPDILYEQELKQQHGHLPKLGLQTLMLESEAVDRMIELNQNHHLSGVSSNDLSTIALAEQENATLLTGDRKLRKVCELENKEVRGTIWLVGEMIAGTRITSNQAEIAYNKMLNSGSRLPENQIKQQLKRHN